MEKKLSVSPSYKRSQKILENLNGIDQANNENISGTTSLTSQQKSNTSVRENDDFDEICRFRDSFKHPVVFFILQSNLLAKQIENLSSAMNLIQHSLNYCLKKPVSNNQGISCFKPSGCARVFVLPDISSILHTMSAVVDSLTHEKRSLKEKYFAKKAEETYLPDSNGKPPSESAASSHVAQSFQTWAIQSGISVVDANVLMNVFGSLANIISADAKDLEHIPVDTSTKEILLDSFHSPMSLQFTKRNENSHFLERIEDNISDLYDCGSKNTDALVNNEIFNRERSMASLQQGQSHARVDLTSGEAYRYPSHAADDEVLDGGHISYPLQRYGHCVNQQFVHFPEESSEAYLDEIGNSSAEKRFYNTDTRTNQMKCFDRFHEHSRPDAKDLGREIYSRTNISVNRQSQIAESCQYQNDPLSFYPSTHYLPPVQDYNNSGRISNDKEYSSRDNSHVPPSNRYQSNQRW